MEELKFRAWNGVKYWYDVVPLFGTMEIMLNNPFAGNKLHKVKAFEQFTGLKDKNGKNVYEGDVMQTAPPAKFYRFVYYDAPDWVLLRCDGKKNEVRFGLGAINNSSHPDAIVVGNIYENPELLNSK